MKKAYVTIAAAAISVAILLGATFASFHLTQRPSADNENGALLPDEDGGTLPPAPEPEAPDEKPLPPQEPETDVPVVTIPKDQYVRSKVNGLNIRSAPSTSASSLGYIDKGDMVLLKGKEGNWYETVYKNKPAYVSAGSSYTELFELEISPDSRVEAVIGEGYNLLGFPYVYGATRLHNGNGKFLSGFVADAVYVLLRRGRQSRIDDTHTGIAGHTRTQKRTFARRPYFLYQLHPLQ